MRAILILVVALLLLGIALLPTQKRDSVDESGDMVLPTAFPERLGAESAEVMGAMLYESSAGTLSEEELEEAAQGFARKRSAEPERWADEFIKGYYHEADHPRSPATNDARLKK